MYYIYYIIFIIIIITAIYFTINNMLNKTKSIKKSSIPAKKILELRTKKERMISEKFLWNSPNPLKNNIINNQEKQNFPCYGNDYCNGNKNNALCINQRCKQCGLVPQCKEDSDCGPNNCIDGCCDTL